MTHEFSLADLPNVDLGKVDGQQRAWYLHTYAFVIRFGLRCARVPLRRTSVSGTVREAVFPPRAHFSLTGTSWLLVAAFAILLPVTRINAWGHRPFFPLRLRLLPFANGLPAYACVCLVWQRSVAACIGRERQMVFILLLGRGRKISSLFLHHLGAPWCVYGCAGVCVCVCHTYSMRRNTVPVSGSIYTSTVQIKIYYILWINASGPWTLIWMKLSTGPIPEYGWSFRFGK